MKGNIPELVLDYIPGAKDFDGPANWETSFTSASRNGALQMPLIIPPSRKRAYLKGRAARERQLLKPVWERLREHLPEIESCFIAGWSAPATDTYVFEHLSGLKTKCASVSVLNRGDDQLRDILEPRYRRFLPSTVSFRWDFEGMRAANEMPLWKSFLGS